MVAAFRRHTLGGRDDYLHALEITIPHPRRQLAPTPPRS